MGKGGRGRDEEKWASAGKQKEKGQCPFARARPLFLYLGLSLFLLPFEVPYILPRGIRALPLPPHFRQETFYRCRFLTAREITLYAANSRKTRKRESSFSLSGMHTEERSRVNVTRRRVTNGSWLFNITAYLSTNGSASREAGIAKPLSSCYPPPLLPRDENAF